LYLIVPANAGAAFADAVARALDAGDVACLLLRAGADGRADRALADRLCTITETRDAEFLIENDVALAGDIGADGVHIAGSEAGYDTARSALGSEAVVGVACPPERHITMVLGEKGADYVAITSGQPPNEDSIRRDFLGWWAEVVEVPLVAWNARSAEEACDLASTGADFVSVEEAVWEHAHGPEKAVREFCEALAARRSAA
jgi:thiamine-phosphate pyrophosphorylase